MKDLNIREFLDNNRTSKFQYGVIILMFLTVVMDGVDIAIMGFIAPALKVEWGITNLELAPVLGAALLGLAIGAMVAGPIADKIGRKKVLVVCVFIFGFFTLIGALSESTRSLIIFRFIAGLAMGGVMPQAATLITEYSPKKNQALFVTIVFAGFTVGAAGGGFIASWMIPIYGWEAVLILCGGLPVMMSFVLILLLPESISFMVLNQYPHQKIMKIVNKIKNNAADSSTSFFMPQAKAIVGKPIKTVLNSYFIVGSCCLWIAYFFGLFLVYLLGSWLPLLINESGFNLSQAAIIAALFQLGGPLGSVTSGWLMDRFNPDKTLASMFAIGALIMVGMSYVTGSFVLLCLIAFFIGFCFNGGNTGMNALSSMFFPTSARATGNSWMHGIGRVGAIISAYAGAIMLDLGWTLSQVFMALTIPALMVSVCILLKLYFYRENSGVILSTE